MRKIPLSDIVRIEYEPQDKGEFEQALQNGETHVFVCLKDNTRIDATKPICIQKDDNSLVYLKIPNPCNHKPQISYIEAAVALLARELLIQKGVLVPEYEVIELNLISPLIEGISKTPCCLIETLENFIPFGSCGDDIVVDPTKISLHRLSEEKQNSHARQTNILFSKEFAAFAAVSYFIANNDSHQENFGTASLNQQSYLAAIDFDMAPIPFLVDMEIFGPTRAPLYTREDHYHADEGGRNTPHSIDLMSFPVSPINANCPIPDNWFTSWCRGFGPGLEASSNKAIFRNEVVHIFTDLANLSNLFFEKTFKAIVPKEQLKSNPELEKLLADLATFFKNHRQKHNKAVMNQVSSILENSFRETSSARSTESSPLFTPGFFHAPPADRKKIGGSPDMDEVLFPPPKAMHYKK